MVHSSQPFIIMRKPPVDYAINFEADGPASLENAYQLLPSASNGNTRPSNCKIPAFDVFQVAAGGWAARKRQWICDVDIWGEEGRDSEASQAHDVQVDSLPDGTSVFDPVLCEIGYTWFCPKGGCILDPFAGGSTRGLVAAYLGYDYTGIEIRQGQVEANHRQFAALKARHDKMFAAEISSGTRLPMKKPNWIVGDSQELEAILPIGQQYDLLFTCPPYFDLEIYSTKDGDGSRAQTYQEFLIWYEAIFRQSNARLRKNRFAIITVGDVRDKNTGAYRLLPEDTTILFARKLGLVPYNKAILCTPIGSLRTRAAATLRRNRKLGHAYQEVKIFWNGEDKKEAVRDALGELELDAIQPLP
jgi:DNA modification methylase